MHAARQISCTRDPWLTNRTCAGGLAAIVSIAVHALLFTSLVGTSASRPQHPLKPSATNGLADVLGTDAAMQWIVLEDRPAVPSEGLQTIRTVSPANLDQLEPPEFQPAAPNYDLTIDEDKAANSSSLAGSASDEAQRSALYGRYLRQVIARIDRAWQRPRALIGASVFSCRVRVDQDTLGRVLAVTVERCDSEPHWQESLIHAIRLASPLPAPSSPRVFASTLRLSFLSEPYSPTAMPDLYEPAAP
jgi:hypothetical protein